MSTINKAFQKFSDLNLDLNLELNSICSTEEDINREEKYLSTEIRDSFKFKRLEWGRPLNVESRGQGFQSNYFYIYEVML